MNNQYLSEEKYQKINKKLSLVSKVVLVAGLAIGATLISIGVITKNNVNKENKELKNEIREENKIALEKDKQEISKFETEIAELESQKKALDDEIENLKIARDEAFSKDAFGSEYKRLNNEINKKRKESFELNSQIASKETDKFEIESDLSRHDESSIESTYNSKKKSEPSFVYTCFGLGGMALFMGVTWSLSLFFVTKRRSIMAYQMQSVMPVAKEGMKEMAPVVGETAGTIMKEMAPAYKEMAKTMAPVYGEIAKEVGKGISEGINEGKSGDNNE